MGHRRSVRGIVQLGALRYGEMWAGCFEAFLFLTVDVDGSYTLWGSLVGMGMDPAMKNEKALLCHLCVPLVL